MKLLHHFPSPFLVNVFGSDAEWPKSDGLQGFQFSFRITALDELETMRRRLLFGARTGKSDHSGFLSFTSSNFRQIVFRPGPV